MSTDAVASSCKVDISGGSHVLEPHRVEQPADARTDNRTRPLDERLSETYTPAAVIRCSMATLALAGLSEAASA